MEVPECKICINIMHNDENRKPRILSCGHTFCSGCLEKLINDHAIVCPTCRCKTEVANASVENLTVNFQVMEFANNYCFGEQCTQRFDANTPHYNCAHCSNKICMQCVSKHFEEYKSTSLKCARECVHKYEKLSANAKHIRSYVKSDQHWTNMYMEKNLIRIKNAEQRMSVEATIEEFLTRIQGIFEKIEREILILDKSFQKSEEIVKDLDGLNFELNSLDKENDAIRRIHSFRSALNGLEKYTPTIIDEKINIENDSYELENPIIIHKDKWIRYELDVAALDGRFDPEMLFKLLHKDVERKSIHVAIGVVGRSGVGKSSFLNSFFGLTKDDPNYIRTDFVECTDEPRPYYVDKEKYENLVIWDTPGVGTVKFQFEKYQTIIEHIKCDAFVYLYETQFNEVDKQVLEMIRERAFNRDRVFICRTKVDSDFKRIAEKIEKCAFNKMSKDVKEYYSTDTSERYKKAFDELKKKYEKDKLSGNVYLKDENKIFYVSNDEKFRDLFEFNEFRTHLTDSLPEVQRGIIIDEIKTKSIWLLGKKREIIENEIVSMANNTVYIFDNRTEYRMWLNFNLQDYARRLTMNEAFKNLILEEVKQSDIDELLAQIQDDVPLRMKTRAIHNSDSSDITVTGDVKLDIRTHIVFTLRNFGTKEKLIKMTIKFLKANLDKLFEHSKNLLVNYYLAAIEKNQSELAGVVSPSELNVEQNEQS